MNDPCMAYHINRTLTKSDLLLWGDMKLGLTPPTYTPPWSTSDNFRELGGMMDDAINDEPDHV